MLAKDLIFDAKNIDYAHLKSRVRVSLFHSVRSFDDIWLLKDAVEKVPEFQDVFLSPHRTKIIMKEIGDKCRNVKNSYRKAVNFVKIYFHKIDLFELSD